MRLPALFIKGRKVAIPLIITVVAVALASPALQTTPAQAEPIWPTSWMIIDEDANEAGTGDDYRDVQTALYNYDDDYLYLRLCLYAAPDFSGPSRYKWFIDLGAGDPLNLSGGSIFGADYLLFTEDGDDDSTGEVYVLPDTDSDGAFSEYEPTQYITTPGPVTDPTIAGYRFDDNCVDMYIKLSELGRSNPFSINLAWSTDTENPNLEQASTQDRIDELDIPIYIESLVNVSITDTPDPADAGSELTYTITYANTGTDNAAGVVITHTLPTEVTFVSAEPAPTSVSAGELIWDIGELAPDGTHTITVCVTVNSPIPDGTVITNSANMTSSIGASSDAEETTISSAPILAIEKEDAPDPVRAGRGLTYTIVYENTGNEIAHDVVIADQLPPEVAYDSANPLPTTVSDTSLTWEIGELSPEDGPQIIIVYTDVHRGTPRGTILENKVDITCSQEVTADATATTRVTVRRPSPSPSPAPRPEPIPPSEPEPEPSPPPEPAPVPPPLPEPSPPSPPVILPNVSADDIVPLSVELVNHGPSAAPFCTLECVLPNEMHIIEASVAPKGSLSILGNKITGALGTIEVGDSTIINMNAEVAGTVEADTPIDELLRQTTLNLSNQPILEDMSLSGLITEDLVIRLGERKYWQYVTFVKKIGEEANISTKLTRIRNLEGAFSIIMRVYGEVWDTQEIATGDDLGQETEHEIDLKINGEVWQTKTLTFQPGETQELVFNVHNLPKERLRLPGNFTLPWWIVPSGAYFVEVNGVQGEVSSAWWIRWWLITIISGVIVGLIWLSIIRRKNRRKTHD